MSEIFSYWRGLVAYMFLFPWPKSRMPEQIAGEKYNRDYHVTQWWLGWALSLVGIVGVGFYTPYVTEQLILPHWSILVGYEEYLVVAVAFLGGFVWQLLWVLFLEVALLLKKNEVLSVVVVSVGFIGPFVLSGWMIYWYLTHFAPNHNLVGTGIIGATVLKVAFAFVPGIIKGVITGTFFTWLAKVIRGGRQPMKPA